MYSVYDESEQLSLCGAGKFRLSLPRRKEILRLLSLLKFFNSSRAVKTLKATVR